MKTHQEIVKRDDEWLTENLPKLKTVHDRILSEYNDPEQREKHLTNTAQYTEDQIAIHLSEKYVDIKRQQDELDRQLKVVKNELIDRIHGNSLITPFIKATLSKPRRMLDQKALFAACKESGIDPEKFYEQGAQAWRITVTDS